MSVSLWLESILVCPGENGRRLKMADPVLVESVNRLISSGRVRNRTGTVVSQDLEDALVTEDEKVLFPVCNGIPVLVSDDAIDLVE